MAEKKSYPEFQKLLKDGIGTRTQKEFADETGITKETINRWLNNDTISQPGKDSLQRIAKHVKSHTLNEFLTACGYDALTIEEDVEDSESDLLGGLESLSGRLFKSISEYLKTVEVLWLKKGVFGRVKQEVEINDVLEECGEYYVESSYLWTHERHDCITQFRLYYSKTSKNNIVVLKTRLVEANKEDIRKNAKVVDHTIVCEEKKKASAHTVPANAEEKLFNAIFGENCYINTYLGFGFYLKKLVPDNFKEYLYNHASSFCTSKHKQEIFEEISNVTDLDNFFSDIIEGEGNHVCDMDAGQIIADILSTETGKDFQYYIGLEKNDEADCVMMLCDNCYDINHTSFEVKNAVCEAAKELGIPEFGACYNTEECPKVGDVYKTSTFHVEFE